MKNKTEKMLALLKKQRVIPVIIISDSDDAVPLAQALVEGGLPAIEITLRTQAACESIRRIAKEVPDACVGAGTILSPQHFQEARDSGARFIVSPGITKDLVDISHSSDIPWLPGAITPTELMVALSYNIDFVKFFPAEAAGGVNFLKSLASPFPNIKFCPTGGIVPEKAIDYLALSHVMCIGSSWVAPCDIIKKKDWSAIKERAQKASLFNTGS